MTDQDHMKSLYMAQMNQTFLIHKVQIKGDLKRRLLDLGFVPGSVIKVLKASPLGDPISYRVAGTVIALRKEESQLLFGEVMKP